MSKDALWVGRVQRTPAALSFMNDIDNLKLIRVTEELIKKGEQGQGGFNRRQIEALGITWPPRHGWKRRALGTLITEEAAYEFVALKGITNRRVKRKTAALKELLLNLDAEP